ncbi:MAG: hypothetical protein K6E35_00230 [Bacteroidales bacterium]|nr:hypothetical protein [Bacteroidales bacterium]
MMNRLIRLFGVLAILTPLASAAQDTSRVEDTARRLVEAGFTNVRAVETSEFTAFTIENDRYKLPAEGFAYAVQLLEESGLDLTKPVKIIGTSHKVPEVTISFDPQTGSWRTTKRLDAAWDAVRRQPMRNNSFLNTDITVYPVVSLINLIINQVYQSRWELKPALEIELWPGARFSYQLVVPVFTDFFDTRSHLLRPGLISFSQRFRDPWHLNIQGKLTLGQFSSDRFGAALEAAYWFPNERFWVDTQLGLVSPAQFFGFHWRYAWEPAFLWNVAGNYYNAALQTQFTLRAQRFIYGDYGLKFEMVRHFRHVSVGFYAERGLLFSRFGGLMPADVQPHTNGGFRVHISLPPYRARRYGRIPRITTSGQLTYDYNANNEQVYYKEFRTEAADNLVSKNYFNPYYINGIIGGRR